MADNTLVRRQFNYLYVLVGVPCIFLMIITSRGFTSIKTILLLLLCIISLFECLILKKKFTRKLLIFLLIFVIYSFIELLNGLFRGYEFSFTTDFGLIQYYVFTPVIIVLLAYIFYFDQGRIAFLINLMRIITLMATVLDVCKLLAYRNLIPDIDFLDLIMVASSRTYDYELTLRVSNEYVLMFLLPLIIVEFFSPQTRGNFRIVDTISIIFGVIYCLLSGRKSLEIVVFLTIVCMIVYSFIRLKQFKNLLKFILIFAVILILINSLSEWMGLNNIIEMAKQTLINGLGRDTYSVTYRASQIIALTNLWLDSPLIGNGLNSYVEGFLANNTTKWSYEVFYSAYLAQTGIIGAGLLLYAILSLLVKNIQKFHWMKDDYCLAVFLAFASFIISGATNPMVYVSWPWAFTFVMGSFYRQEDFYVLERELLPSEQQLMMRSRD